MNNFDLPTFLVAFAGGLAAMWTLVMATRSVTRSRPVLSIAEASIGSEGLSLTLRNEGSTPASGIEVRLSGEHDGTILFLHDAIGPASMVLMADMCPPGSRFDIDILYRDGAGVGFAAQRTLQRDGAGPLRIVSAADRVVQRRLRDWCSDMLRR